MQRSSGEFTSLLDGKKEIGGGIERNCSYGGTRNCKNDDDKVDPSILHNSIRYSSKMDHCLPPLNEASTASTVDTIDGVWASPRQIRVEYANNESAGLTHVQSLLSFQGNDDDDTEDGSSIHGDVIIDEEDQTQERDGLLRKMSSASEIVQASSSRLSTFYYNYISQRTSLSSSSMRAATAKELWPKIDPNAVHFGIRMAILLTIAGFFIFAPAHHYPDGMWVLVSVLFVCWFPSLDAASVIEKVVQRLIGTFIGAIIGLSCGFLSLWVLKESSEYQFLFLSSCMFVFNFLIIFLAGQCKVGNEKVIVKFSYATILCVLTFCISLGPFGSTTSSSQPQWSHGIIRVVNVVIGCLLGAMGSIAICPKSTADVLYEKTARQVRLAGEASEALMQGASDYFSGRAVRITRLADEILHQPIESSMRWKLRRQSSGLSDEDSNNNISDVKSNRAVKKYEDAIMEWRATKSLFPLARYDPFSIPDLHRNNKATMIQTDIAQTLARALRIQTTIVVMDGMVRNDADYEFTRDQLILFGQIGSLIRRMLTVPLNLVQTNAAAAELFTKLDQIRNCILYVSAQVAAGPDDGNYSPKCVQTFKDSILNDIVTDFDIYGNRIEDDEGRGILKNATGKHDNTLFFLQLVEHLILRSLRLYQAWKHVEIKASI